jgi:serine/threonine protein kinase
MDSDLPPWAIWEEKFVVDLRNLLGKGVYKAVLHGTPVAAKSLDEISNLQVCMGAKELQDTVQELTKDMEFLLKIRHPNLVQFIGAVFDQTQLPIWILSEFVPGGSLDKLLNFHESHGTFLPKKYVVHFARDILAGLDCLHTQFQVIHKNIKPSNVLINLEGNCKLCDFGISFQRNKPPQGNPKYIAPEILQSLPYNSSADIWSFGVLLIEMVLNSMGHDLNPDQIVKVEKSRALEKYLEMSKILEFSCLLDGAKRRSAKELLSILPEEYLSPFSREEISTLQSQLPRMCLSTHKHFEMF